MLCQACKVFGSTRHGPHSVWVKHGKTHNNGRAINLRCPSECQIAREVLQFLCFFCLKTTLQACTWDSAFVDYKKLVSLLIYLIELNFGSVSLLLFRLSIHCIVYCRLHIADTMVCGMEKLCYSIRQTDRLLEPGMEKMLHMELSKLKLTKADGEWLKS